LNPVELFISHATEDKDTFVRPLADALIQRPGLRVFYDEYSLVIGDSLLASVSKGLHKCDFGVVVFSPDFLRKKWPQEELAGLFARETIERKIILPIWHNLGRDDILAVYPSFADRIAAKSADGIERVVSDIMRAVQVSQRTKQVNTPILNRIESVANKAVVQARSDQLRNSQQGIRLVEQEAKRLFDLFQSYLEPYKDRIHLEIVRNSDQGFVFARTLQSTRINRQESLKESRRSKIAFRCEFFTFIAPSLRTLKLCLYHEIYNWIGQFQEPVIINEWNMTPVFNHLEEVVWTNFQGIRDMTSEDLLDHTLTFFVDAIDRSISYGNPA
jgi:hypothetical protein